MSRARLPGRWLLVGVLVLALSGDADAGQTFVDSDDYRDGEAVVDRFLRRPDYERMVEDIERNGQTFDWGWVKTPGSSGPSSQPAAEPRGGLRRLLGREGGHGQTASPRQLGFDLATYQAVCVPAVQNFAGVIAPGVTDAVHAAFVEAARELGLRVAADGSGSCDLELGVAIVDLKRDSTYVFFANVDPFIDLEVRLVDRKTGDSLLLLRNRAHSNTPSDAALNYASALVQFLR